MPGIDTVLFDLDGTLVDSRADLVASVNVALAAVGFKEKSSNEIIPHVGNGLRDLLLGVFGPVDEKTLEIGSKAFKAHYEEHCVDKTVLYAGAGDMLADLSRTKKLGIVTNKPWGFADKILKKLDVANSISVLVGGDSFPEKKPHPRPVLEAVKQLSGQASTTLILGDGVQDIKAGQAAGIKTCAARYGYGFVPETMNLKPDFSITTFNELKEIVK